MENWLFKILTNLSKIPEQLNYMTKCVLTSIAFFRNVNAAFGKDVTHNTGNVIAAFGKDVTHNTGNVNAAFGKDVTHNTAFYTAQKMLKNFSIFYAVWEKEPRDSCKYVLRSFLISQKHLIVFCPIFLLQRSMRLVLIIDFEGNLPILQWSISNEKSWFYLQ